MKTIDAILQSAEQHCSKRGTRLTPKRKQMLSGLVASKKAVSAYELIDYCKEHYGSEMPAMSVYRILDFLVEERLVHRLKLANKYVACSHITCDHAHEAPQFLICGECHRVEEVAISKSTMSELELAVKDVGFQMVGSQLEMNCVCDSCAS